MLEIFNASKMFLAIRHVLRVRSIAAAVIAYCIVLSRVGLTGGVCGRLGIKKACFTGV
jgi:hypothetical protein